ncbi:MAG: DUF4878 domain-containing protein [Treponema sp.]|nr:DUF4878 domain-containing protein [Treponema sp.]
MKKFSLGLISFTMIIGLVVVGCGNIGGSPTSVVKRYYAALAKGDVKALGEVMTAKGVQYLTPFMSKAKDRVAALGKITKTEETIDGDTGIVKVTFSNGTTEKVSVRKVDGKWKISEWDKGL